ncbi:MAG: 3-hydroxyacyl-CoA dehydrogenase family protein [Opitutaceae bacterium]|nr:3-hydroxyacyl-CoA dehydrogenase family protein [Opitutaceae bacterium]
MEKTKHIFVAGAGLMGSGIAQVAATAGFRVTLYDVAQFSLEKAKGSILSSLEKLSLKNRISASPETIMEFLDFSQELDDASGCDLVIEAVPEVKELKGELFQKLDDICAEGVFFASNTSAIPISTLAGYCRRPELFCGVHFFSPVPLMPLVEIIRGEKTSDKTIDEVRHMVAAMGKEPVTVEKDIPGFIVNRVFFAAALEAARLVEKEVTSATNVDKAMELGCAWKMGPLATCDLAGLDVIIHAADTIYNETKDSVFKVPENMRALMKKGHLGRKTGRGFYNYS